MAATAESSAALGKVERTLKKAGLSAPAINAFLHNYAKLRQGDTGLVPESDIDAVKVLPKLNDLDAGNLDAGLLRSLLKQTVVLKLNGGLGTSMGLEKAKSLLKVKGDNTFLDLIAMQVKHLGQGPNANVHFVLMNSFSTNSDTLDLLKKKHPDLSRQADLVLLQNKSPKIDAETLEPVKWKAAADLEWCPPGHGDIYPSLLGSGMLDRLAKKGFRYVFVSNSDNLGAVLSTDLLVHFAQSGAAFMMEVAERTEADKKGGHLCRRRRDGQLILRESAMCPDNDKASFQDVSLHKYFNTNNLWLDLEQVKAMMDQGKGVLPLPLIKNKKTVNPRDSSTPVVYQLETAMGSAIECFPNAIAVVVPRTRFSPVKTCNDLFSLRSDAYDLSPDYRVMLCSDGASQPAGCMPCLGVGGRGAGAPPVVKLDDRYYKLVDQMEALCPPECLPSLRECTRLEVKGPVSFSKGTTFKGKCTVVNADLNTPKQLPPGVYQDQVVNL